MVKDREMVFMHHFYGRGPSCEIERMAEAFETDQRGAASNIEP
jgi:hypothetical protein